MDNADIFNAAHRVYHRFTNARSGISLGQSGQGKDGKTHQ
jgi:hypothetical protein